MTIGITGSTGALGRLVINRLKRMGRSEEVIALARTPDKAADLGVAVRQADYDQPDTLETALANVDTLLLISGSEVGSRIKQHTNVLRAAKAKGIRHVVYTSVLHADTSPLGLLAEEHRATESALKASGLPHTFLRNGWYLENYDNSLAAASTHGALVGSAGTGKISAAARADYAEAAARVLTTPALQSKTHELAGDQAFTLADLAAELGRQLDKPIPYRDLPVERYAQVLVEAGLPAELAQAIASWDAATAQDALFDDGGQLGRLLGRPTTDMASYVGAYLTKK